MFKDKIRQYRKSSGFGVSEAALEIIAHGAKKITRQTIWSWENGLSVPEQDKYLAIKKAYNLTYSQYLDLLDLAATAAAERSIKQLSTTLDNSKEKI